MRAFSSIQTFYLLGECPQGNRSLECASSKRLLRQRGSWVRRLHLGR
jgi:hypothetical protein